MNKNLLTVLLGERMKEKNYSMRDVAKETGVSHTTISRILAGQTADIDTLIAICKWMNVSPSHFLDAQMGGEQTLGARMSAVLEANPALATVLEEALERMEDGRLSPQTLTDLVNYMVYRIGLDTKSRNE